MKRGLAFKCMCTLVSYGENVLKDSLWMSGVSVHHCGIIKDYLLSGVMRPQSLINDLFRNSTEYE